MTNEHHSFHGDLDGGVVVDARVKIGRNEVQQGYKSSPDRNTNLIVFCNK